MKTNQPPAGPAADGIDAVKPPRPKTVQYSIYLLSVRGVFSVLAALSLHGARGEVRSQLADANKTKGWDNAELNHQTDLVLRASLLNAGVLIILLALLAKFIWDGKPWARWAYLAVIVLLARDQNSVIGFFAYHHLLIRVTTGIVGVAGLASLVLLFVPASNAYFRPLGRPAGAPGGLFGAMLGSRAGARPAPAAGPARTAVGRPAARPAKDGSAKNVSLTKPAAGSGAASTDAAGSARAGGPRGKSRQSPPKRPPGGAR